MDFRVNRVGGAILSVVRRDWLQTSTGVNVVAVELFAIMFSVILFTSKIGFGQTMAAVFPLALFLLGDRVCLER